MTSSEQPARVTLEVVVWWDDDETIGLVMPDLQGSLVRIEANARRANGHPALHEVLSYCLRTAAAEALRPGGGGAEQSG